MIRAVIWATLRWLQVSKNCPVSFFHSPIIHDRVSIISLDIVTTFFSFQQLFESCPTVRMKNAVYSKSLSNVFMNIGLWIMKEESIQLSYHICGWWEFEYLIRDQNRSFEKNVIEVLKIYEYHTHYPVLCRHFYSYHFRDTIRSSFLLYLWKCSTLNFSTFWGLFTPYEYSVWRSAKLHSFLIEAFYLPV